MQRLKTLVYANTERILNILLSALRYGSACVFLKWMNYWTAMGLWVAVWGVFYIFINPNIHYNEVRGRFGKNGGIAFIMSVQVISFALISLGWYFLHWLMVPIYAVGNEVLLYSVFQAQYKPIRTKTPPPDEEAKNDEDHSVDGSAQNISAGDIGPDPDGDSEDQGQKHSGRYKWGTGEPIGKKEEEV